MLELQEKVKLPQMERLKQGGEPEHSDLINFLNISFAVFATIMYEIKKISIKILTLIFDIFLFGYKMIKQVILPNRKRKGNVLSSIFIFFLGILERINQFEHGLFSMTAVLKQKYVKQTILIIGGILFFLSSFEWTGERGLTITENGRYTEQPSSQVTKKIVADKHEQSICYSKHAGLIEEYSEFQSNLHNSITSPSSVKKYLFVHSLRI